MSRLFFFLRFLNTQAEGKSAALLRPGLSADPGRKTDQTLQEEGFINNCESQQPRRLEKYRNKSSAHSGGNVFLEVFAAASLTDER